MTALRFQTGGKTSEVTGLPSGGNRNNNDDKNHNHNKNHNNNHNNGNKIHIVIPKMKSIS